MNIAVDFDGVIHRYSRGWQDGAIYDRPVIGAREALSSLLAAGHEVVIFSTRCRSPEERGAVQAWLKEYEIPYTKISDEAKPIAHVYIDDRALRFDGDWGATLTALGTAGVDQSWASSETGLDPFPTPTPEERLVWLARVLHESGREAVARNLVYRNDLPVKPFCEWDDLSDDAKEGRRLMAEYVAKVLALHGFDI